MKKTIILTVMLFIGNLCGAQELKTANDTLSYAVGLLTGQNMKTQGFAKINSTILAQAFSDAMGGGKTKIEMDKANQLVQTFMMEQKGKATERNKAEGAAFLMKNAEREGVVTLESGLQYEVIKEGTGILPKADDKVNVHYHGTLINGDVFDSSVRRGEPISFSVNGVIKGWQEGLQLMPVGSKWKLFIPEDLAYGARGAGAKIGPFAALVFEVELLGIE